MSGSIETIPTQPSWRSPKCTLPSRPRGDPAGPAHVLRQDPRRRHAADEVRRQVAVQDAQPVLGGHRERRPGRHRLLAEAVVERAGHLALAVQAHGPLLDAAHQQHRPQQRRSGPRAGGARLAATLPTAARPSRVGRHLLLFSLSVGWAGAGSPSATRLPHRAASGICRRAPLHPGSARELTPRASACASAARPIDAGNERSSVDGSAWLARAALATRGAWLWPMFVVHRRSLDGLIAHALPIAGRQPERRRRPGRRADPQPAGGRAAARGRSGLLLRRWRRTCPVVVARNYAGTAAVLVGQCRAAGGGPASTVRTIVCHAADAAATRSCAPRPTSATGRRPVSRQRRAHRHVHDPGGSVYRTCVPSQRPDAATYCVIVKPRLPFAQSVVFAGYEPNSLFAQGHESTTGSQLRPGAGTGPRSAAPGTDRR